MKPLAAAASRACAASRCSGVAVVPSGFAAGREGVPLSSTLRLKPAGDHPTRRHLPWRGSVGGREDQRASGCCRAVPDAKRVGARGIRARPLGLPLALSLLALLGACTMLLGEGLSWESGPGHRRARVVPNGAGRPGFTLLSAETTGIRWTNRLSTERYMERQNLMNGAGVALGDFDNDGWCDIYLCNKQGPNALLRNLGRWRFTNVAEQAGVACTNQSSTGAVFADLNGDGHLDLLVNSFAGPNACLMNLGDGRFTNLTHSAGLLSKGGTTSMALGDIDGDGDLDLYVCYFGIEAILRDGGAISTREVGGKTVITGRYAKRLALVHGRLIEFGEPDILYRNEGQGRFAPLEWKETFFDEDGKPMSPPPDFGLAVQIRDINADGFPDIYVCNDFQTPDRIWLNDGQGRFRAAPRLALRNMSYASMGVDFGDLDRDGRLDFYTVEMLSRDYTRHLRQSSPLEAPLRAIGAIENREEVARNALYWNRGDGTYAEMAFYAGLAATDWSWTPILLDVDLDGYEDVLVSNGHLHDVNDRDITESRPTDPAQRLAESRRVLLRYPRLDTPNAAYRNRGDLTFEDAAEAWGFDSRSICHGMALADLDNDGDQDLVCSAVNEPPLLYRNDTAAPRIAVRLKGRPPNVQGIGALVVLRSGQTGFLQMQEMLCGGRYLSGDDPLRTFAVPESGGPLTIEVFWRSGRCSVIPGVLANHVYEIDEATAVAAEPAQAGTQRPADASRSTTPPSRIPNPAALPVPGSGQPPLFTDLTSALNHTHHEAYFDDFVHQPMLPRRLSQLGPGVACFDFNADGHDDLLIGNGRGGALALFFGDGKGGFSRAGAPALNAPLTDDAAGIVGFSQERTTATVFIGAANFETDGKTGEAVWRFDVAAGTVSPGASLPGLGPSTGPLAMADVDADGDLDLFAGGRLIAGRYPEPAASRVFRNDQGSFVPDAEINRLLERLGLVSAALFSDLTGDGWPELILACEWGPLRLFKNQAGRLEPWEPPLTWSADSARQASPSPLRALTGWWTSVTAGDLDGDGRLDLIAGNWGLNTPYHQRAPRGPWSLFYGDFSGDGHLVLVEGWLDPARNKVVPWRDLKLLSQDWPALRQRFTTHAAFARASVAEVLGQEASKARELRATQLASLVFLNRGEAFAVAPLPREVQWTPVHGLTVADFDGDGHEDVFVAQNYFAVRTEDNRYDAGRGLLLRGDGHGRLTPVDAQESGLAIYGEQRGSAAGDFDEDGRADLVVTQNGAPTKLYRNTRARAGLRVRLAAGPNNPHGIGAVLRVGVGPQVEPATAVQVGGPGQPAGGANSSPRYGPAREVRAGNGYWSQDSPVQVVAAAEQATSVWIRWPGGKETTHAIPAGAKEIAVDAGGGLSVLR